MSYDKIKLKNFEKTCFIICLKFCFMIEYSMIKKLGGEKIERTKQPKTKI